MHRARRALAAFAVAATAAAGTVTANPKAAVKIGEESVLYGDGLRIAWALESTKLRIKFYTTQQPGSNDSSSVEAAVGNKLLSADWLRERCTSKECVDAGSGQPLHDLHDPNHFSEDMHVSYVGLRQEDGASLLVRLTGRVPSSELGPFTCEYSLRSLVDELMGQRVVLQADPIKYPTPMLWTAASLTFPPVFDYQEVSTLGIARDQLIGQLLIIGIALVVDCPLRPGVVVDFARSVSTLRVTEWGDTFNVRTVPDVQDVAKQDLAYTPLGIGMHTDNPYRDPMPDFQLLHQIDGCVCPDEIYPCPPTCNVDNYFSDGFAAALHLKKHDPEAFKILTEIPVRWENNGGDRSKGGMLVTSAPHIELQAASDGNPCYFQECLMGIRFSAKSGGYSPHIEDPEREQEFFRARREFSRLLAAPEFKTTMHARPGHMLVFDNRRILHGRGFIQSDVPRWVQGAYMNRDGLWYEFAKSQRRTTAAVQDANGLWSERSGPLGGFFSWNSLATASKEDYEFMGKVYSQHVDQHVMDHMLDMLKVQKHKNLGQPVDLYEHGLQTASRAYRAGESEDIIVMSLLHDMTETIMAKNHGGVAASFLEPFLSEKATWMLAHHEIFQGFYYFHHFGGNRNERDRYKDHQWYGDLVRWCEEYDQNSFDVMYPNLPLTFFLPMVNRVFSKAPYWWNPSHPKAMAVTGAAQAH